MELRERGVDTASCIERADLVQLLLTNWDVQDKPQPPPAAIASSAADNVSVQQDPPQDVSMLRACQACSGTLGNGAGGKLLKCSRCNGAYYCSKVCQVADWPAHKSQCQTLQLRDVTSRQAVANKVGTEAAAAYETWAKHVQPLIWEAAAAVLWPGAPHLPLRNRSHGLLLHVTYDDSSEPPRFKVERFEVPTQEELSARTATVLGGRDIPWPDVPPGAMGMKVVLFCSFGRLLVLRAIPLGFTSALVTEIKDGKRKLPSTEETFAKINTLSW